MAKVVKFGGSSLADAEHFRQVADIINADKERRFIVPSAPGKRFGDDVKVTDMLIDCYKNVEAGCSADACFSQIIERFDGIITELGLPSDFLTAEYDKIIADFNSRSGADYAASRGEFLNGLILAEHLGCAFVDAADVVKFNADGSFDAGLTNLKLEFSLKDYDKVVIPGFYGAKPGGEIKTFSRGGSDITGSLVAKAVKASLYENWTDVSGILMADPRIIENPDKIDIITYSELRELSYMGATVLHEDAVLPVREAGIPMCIKNTNRPEDVGTSILPQAEMKQVVTGIAGKKNFSIIHIEKTGMNNEVGFLYRILSFFASANINFEHIPTGIDTLSIVVNSDVIEKHPDLCERIREVAGLRKCEIEIFPNLALIAVVGRGMKGQRGIAGFIFSALGHKEINIRTIDQGSSELNIIVGVEETDFEAAILAIYEMSRQFLTSK